MVPQLHFAGGTHAMVRQPSTSIPHDLPTEFVKGDTVGGKTLLLAEGQHRAWAACQPVTSFIGEHEWVLDNSAVVVALRRGEFPPYFYSQILQALRYNSRYSWLSCQNATQTVNEKTKIWGFSLLQDRGEEPVLCWGSNIFQSLLASHILTHPIHTYIHTSLGENNPNFKATPSHLPQRKAVTVNCRIKKVPEDRHYTWKHRSLVQIRKLKERHIQW